MLYESQFFAQAYGAGIYDCSTYQNGNANCSSTTTTTTSSNTAASGLLSNTGFDILLAASIASAIIFAALVVRFWKRPRKQTN